jgi:hypothetical protein
MPARTFVGPGGDPNASDTLLRLKSIVLEYEIINSSGLPVSETGKIFEEKADA